MEQNITPKERAIEMIREHHGSKTMSIHVQQQIVKRLKNFYFTVSKYENAVLVELKKIKSWEI
jgi:hypothetical protein